MGNLCHITRKELIPLIKENGFDRTFPFKSDVLRDSEMREKFDKYAELVEMSKEDYEWEYEEDGKYIYGNYDERLDIFMEEVEEGLEDFGDWDSTKEWFNRFMSKYRKRNKPSHESSVFFWKECDKERTKIDNVVVVDSDKIPCKCYEIESFYSNNVYNAVNDINDGRGTYTLSNCINENINEIEDGTFCYDAHANAMKHYENMREYVDDCNDKGIEILCPCDIPREAIR